MAFNRSWKVFANWIISSRQKGYNKNLSNHHLVFSIWHIMPLPAGGSQHSHWHTSEATLRATIHMALCCVACAEALGVLTQNVAGFCEPEVPFFSGVVHVGVLLVSGAPSWKKNNVIQIARGLPAPTVICEQKCQVMPTCLWYLRRKIPMKKTCQNNSQTATIPHWVKHEVIVLGSNATCP